MRLIEMFHPELERFVDRIFQRLAPILHRYDTCAEAFRKKPLPKTVSDLVCTGMIRPLIFEVGLGASEFLGGTFCEDERSWSTGIIFEQILKLLLKRRIGFCLLEYIC